MDKQNYQKLVAWQNGVTLVKNVYELLKRFPKHENYALADQIRRSAVSVPANIAEGQARQHRKEFLQFLYVAKGSLAELHTLLIVTEQLGYCLGHGLGAPGNGNEPCPQTPGWADC